MNCAKVQVSVSLLRAALGLPENARIIRTQDSIRYMDVIELVVEHPDLPKTEHGQPIIQATPMFRRTEDGYFEMTSWGVES